MAMPELLRNTLVDLYGEANIQALEAAPVDAIAADEFLIEPDAAEAERFRLELERDERNPDNW